MISCIGDVSFFVGENENIVLVAFSLGRPDIFAPMSGWWRLCVGDPVVISGCFGRKISGLTCSCTQIEHITGTSLNPYCGVEDSSFDNHNWYSYWSRRITIIIIFAGRFCPCFYFTRRKRIAVCLMLVDGRCLCIFHVYTRGGIHIVMDFSANVAQRTTVKSPSFTRFYTALKMLENRLFSNWEFVWICTFVESITDFHCRRRNRTKKRYQQLTDGSHSYWFRKFSVQ